MDSVKVGWGMARLSSARFGTAVEASRGNSRSGAVRKGLARRGAAVMVWKSRLGKSGRCKDGRGLQQVTINNGFSQGKDRFGLAGIGAVRQSRRVKLWRGEAWRGCRG